MSEKATAIKYSSNNLTSSSLFCKTKKVGMLNGDTRLFLKLLKMGISCYNHEKLADST